MSEIDLGGKCAAKVSESGQVLLMEWGDLCKWWLEQRGGSQEMRERSDRSGQQSAYTIKPPVWRGVWYGIFLDCAGFSSSVWLEGGTWFAGCSGLSQPFGTEAAARAWCEARYYEWMRQFLSEVKT